MEALSVIQSCDGCGACCRHVGHPMFMGAFPGTGTPEQAWLDLPKSLRREHLDYLNATQGDNYGTPCYWLDPHTHKCKHYEHRPRACRDFEMGAEDCQWLRNTQGVDDSPRAT